MKCPHCSVTVAPWYSYNNLEYDGRNNYGVKRFICPACKQMVVQLVVGERGHSEWHRDHGLIGEVTEIIVHPRRGARAGCPAEAPPHIAEDFNEAALVLTDSPKASAALSRRCLQHILRETAKIKPGNLSNEMQELLNRQTLPTHIAENLDAIRNIGNFAAHPSKDAATGDIAPVEPHEAEWNLDVLELLIDFYYVQPEVAKKKRAALNSKLQNLGKPPMK